MDLKIGKVAPGVCCWCAKERPEIVTVLMPGEKCAKDFCWKDLAKMVKHKLPAEAPKGWDSAATPANGPALKV